MRDWKKWGHHRFMLAVMPDWTLHAVAIAPGDGRPVSHVGVLYRGGEAIPVTWFEMAEMDSTAVPGPLDLEVTTGQPDRLRGHTCGRVYKLQGG